MERSCKNCQQRRVGCHANCERYKADCAQDAKRRAYEKQFAYMDSMPQTATALKKTLAPRRVGGQQYPNAAALTPGRRLSQNREQLPYYREHVAAQPQRAAAKRSEGGAVWAACIGVISRSILPQRKKRSEQHENYQKAIHP